MRISYSGIQLSLVSVFYRERESISGNGGQREKRDVFVAWHLGDVEGWLLAAQSQWPM